MWGQAAMESRAGGEREGRDPSLGLSVGSVGPGYPKPTCDDGLDDAPFILQPPYQHGLGRP